MLGHVSRTTVSIEPVQHGDMDRDPLSWFWAQSARLTGFFAGDGDTCQHWRLCSKQLLSGHRKWRAFFSRFSMTAGKTRRLCLLEGQGSWRGPRMAAVKRSQDPRCSRCPELWRDGRGPLFWRFHMECVSSWRSRCMGTNRQLWAGHAPSACHRDPSMLTSQTSRA